MVRRATKRSRVLVTDTGELRAMRIRLEGLRDRALLVGVFEDAGKHKNSEKGLTVSQVAAANEFGTGNIPSRPAFRQAIDQNRRGLRRYVDGVTYNVATGRVPPRVALERMGVEVQTLIRRRITELNKPPNHPRTVAMKGSSNPLVDSGQLRRSVDYKVATGAEANMARAESADATPLPRVRRKRRSRGKRRGRR